MRTIKVLAGQSLKDLALGYTGGVEGMFDFIELNPSITSIEENPAPGTEIIVPEVVYDNNAVAFFEENGIPATAALLEGYGPPVGGDFDLNDFNTDFG